MIINKCNHAFIKSNPSLLLYTDLIQFHNFLDETILFPIIKHISQLNY